MGSHSSKETNKDEKYALSSPPPKFGHPMLEYFAFEKGYINLNSGSYGAPPNYVIEACARKSQEIEANPDKFVRFAYIPQLRKARERVASLIGADVDECVLVTNATLGVNIVLRNLQWSKEDILVYTSVTYGAVERTIKHECDLPPGPQYSSMVLKFPTSKSELLDNFRAHLKSLPRHQGSKIVAVIDGIVANPGAFMPWEQMVRICKEEGVISLVDAAHNIGQQVGIDLKKADPDFWISNCYKWLYAKHGCAVLYVPKRNQHLIKSSIPTSFAYVSPSDPAGHPEAPNFIEQFNKNGMTDYVPFLSVTPALDFRAWLGGEEKINTYCHELALAGGKRLAELLGTSIVDPNAGDEPTLAYDENGYNILTEIQVNVRLPLDDVPGTVATNSKIMRALLYDWNCYVAHFYHNGAWWVRCSTQIWNEISDFEYLAKALLKICDDIRKDIQ